MRQPLPKPPSKVPPRGGPMSPPPVRAPLPPGPAMIPPKAQAPAPLAARAHASMTQPGQASQATSRAGTSSPPRPGSAAGIARTARVAAAGATGTVGAVIEAVRLVDIVLSEENQVLRRHDAVAVAALQERKLAATRLYHERMRALARDTEATRAMGLEERAELVTLARGLDDRVRENAILLKATMDAIDRLFGCINQAAQQKANKEVSYSRAGMVAANSSPAAASIAFNRTV